MSNYIEKIFLRVGVENKEQLTEEQLQRVFLLAVQDFKNENIFLEELSAFASSIWQEPNSADSSELVTLKETIDNCSEIIFYLHKIPEVDKKAEQTVSLLLSTFQYYEKHKNILV